MKFSLVLFCYIISFNDANNQTKDKVHTDKLPEDIINTGKCCINFGVKEVIALDYRAAEKEGTRWGASPPPFPGANFFFHVKSENKKFLYVKKMWD